MWELRVTFNPSTNKSEYVVFAQKLADLTGTIVIAANDQVTPKKDVSEKKLYDIFYSTVKQDKFLDVPKRSRSRFFRS